MAGLVVLVIGADLLVRGAVVLASVAKIPPLVIGLTVVAFGTSAPELAVSAVSSYHGDSAIALGNVVGSNIINVLLILGLSAVIVPLAVSSQLIRSDVPIMIGVSVLVWLAAATGNIGRVQGVVALAAFIGYTAWLVYQGRRELAENDATDAPPATWLVMLLNLLWLALGLAMLVVGARWLVDSATTIAQAWGVSEVVIGLTIVAAGTSLPELATSVVAATRGQRDIAVGNVVGSNVFNLMMVLPVAAIVSPVGLPIAPAIVWFDLGVMTWVAVLCLPIFVSDAAVSRAEGAVMLSLLLAYISLLIADSVSYPGVAGAKSLFVFAVLPVVCVLIGGRCWFSRRGGVAEVNASARAA